MLEREWVQTKLDCDFNAEGIQRVKDFLCKEAKRNQEERRKAAEEAARKVELRKALRFMLGILTKECPAEGELWKKLEPFKHVRQALHDMIRLYGIVWWKWRGEGRSRQRVYYFPYWKWELTDENSEYYFPEIAKAITELKDTIVTYERHKQEEKVRRWQQESHFPLAVRKPEPWHKLIPKIKNTNPP